MGKTIHCLDKIIISETLETSTQDSQKFCIVEDQLVIEPNTKQNIITWINSWLYTGFFWTIYLARQHSKILGILKYIQLIRLGSTRNMYIDENLLEYDRQFHLKMYHHFSLALSMQGYEYCICSLKFNKLQNSQNLYWNVLIIISKAPNPIVQSSMYACTATSHTHEYIVSPISRPRLKSSDPIYQHSKIMPHNITSNFVPTAQGNISNKDQISRTPVQLQLNFLFYSNTLLNTQIFRLPSFIKWFQIRVFLELFGRRVYLQSKNKSASEHVDKLSAIIEKDNNNR